MQPQDRPTFKFQTLVYESVFLSPNLERTATYYDDELFNEEYSAPVAGAAASFIPLLVSSRAIFHSSFIANVLSHLDDETGNYRALKAGEAALFTKSSTTQFSPCLNLDLIDSVESRYKILKTCFADSRYGPRSLRHLSTKVSSVGDKSALIIPACSSLLETFEVSQPWKDDDNDDDDSAGFMAFDEDMHALDDSSFVEVSKFMINVVLPMISKNFASTLIALTFDPYELVFDDDIASPASSSSLFKNVAEIGKKCRYLQHLTISQSPFTYAEGPSAELWYNHCFNNNTLFQELKTLRLMKFPVYSYLHNYKIISNLPRLRDLSVSSKTGDPTDRASGQLQSANDFDELVVNTVANLHYLENVTISHSFTDESATAIAEASPLTIKSVKFFHTSKMTGSCVKYFRSASEMKFEKCKEMNFDDGEREKVSFSKLTNLDKLSIDDVIESNLVGSLSTLPCNNNSRLTRLSLTNCPLLNTEAILAISKITTLQKLILANVRELIPADFAIIGETMLSVTLFHFNCIVAVTDESVESFVKARAKAVAASAKVTDKKASDDVKVCCYALEELTFGSTDTPKLVGMVGNTSRLTGQALKTIADNFNHHDSNLLKSLRMQDSQVRLDDVIKFVEKAPSTSVFLVTEGEVKLHRYCGEKFDPSKYAKFDEEREEKEKYPYGFGRYE